MCEIRVSNYSHQVFPLHTKNLFQITVLYFTFRYIISNILRRIFRHFYIFVEISFNFIFSFSQKTIFCVFFLFCFKILLFFFFHLLSKSKTLKFNIYILNGNYSTASEILKEICRYVIKKIKYILCFHCQKKTLLFFFSS